MKAFLNVIALVALFIAQAFAFTPGPTIIRECPKCRVPIEERTMASGNTIGARYWSDGKMGAPMLPDYPWLVKCPKCKHLFWVDEAKRLGDTRKGWKGQGKISSQALGIPTISDFCTILPKVKDRRKQLYIRTHLWHCANDRYREAPVAKFSLSPQTKANLAALSRLLNEKDPEERLMKAEIARELGHFEHCIKLLDTHFDKALASSASAIRMLAQEKHAPVMGFGRPERWREPPAASAKPTDIESRLFVRAMDESCVLVANGLLSKYRIEALLGVDPAKIKTAVSAGAAKGDDSVVAVVLNTAVTQDSVEAARLLLDGGARVNGHCDEFWTPLMTASLCGSEKVASLLIDRDAEVNAPAQYGLTPLNLACRERHSGIAKLLLDRGAKVDEPRDCSPLITLCTNTWDIRGDKVVHAKKTLEMVRLLIDHGANVNGVEPVKGADKREFWSTPLTEICGTELLTDESAIVRYTQAERSACEAIYLQIMRLLLDRNADIDKADYQGATPLIRACEARNFWAAKLLLERGADVNKASGDGSTPLSAANRLSDKSIARLLLEHGAKPNARE